MSNFIGLQAGHQNIGSNCDIELRPETGAQGEEPFNVAVRDTLGDILIKYGFQVQLDDADSNCNTNTLSKDFDFYLAIHAEGEPRGGAIAAPDPSVDAANAESKRIVNALDAVYFTDSGIERNDKIIDANMSFYYMWNVLTARTPCGIIECGALQDPHDKVILADTRRVALAIAHGICDAFSVTWVGDPTNPPPQPPDPCADIKREFEDYKATHPTVVTSNIYSTTTSTSANISVVPVTPTTQPKKSLWQIILDFLNSEIYYK